MLLFQLSLRKVNLPYYKNMYLINKLAKNKSKCPAYHIEIFKIAILLFNIICTMCNTLVQAILTGFVVHKQYQLIVSFTGLCLYIFQGYKAEIASLLKDLTNTSTRDRRMAARLCSNNERYPLGIFSTNSKANRAKVVPVISRNISQCK